MAKRRGHSEEHENAERWLLTYADMITLLMAFFIMLYSMSQLDLKKFDAMTGAVQAQLGGTGVLKGSMNVAQGPEQRTGTPGIMPMLGGGPGSLKRTLAKELRPLVSGLQITARNGEVTVVLPATTVYFAPGSAEPSQAMLRALDAIAKALKQDRHAVRVTGHTCSLPVRNGRYSSNWELSADRARNVAFRLIRSGAVTAEHCSYMGLADTHPAFPNDSEAHRARNRRVEIKITPLPGRAKSSAAAPAEASEADSSDPAAKAEVDLSPHLDRAGARPRKEQP